MFPCGGSGTELLDLYPILLPISRGAIHIGVVFHSESSISITPAYRGNRPMDAAIDLAVAVRTPCPPTELVR